MTRPTPEDLDRLLADYLAFPPDLPADYEAAEATRTLQVIQKGKVIGHATETAGDYRPAALQHHEARIRELQRALREGDDPYWIAWVALQVGAGAAYPDVARQALSQRARSQGGRQRAAVAGSELAARNASICSAIAHYLKMGKDLPTAIAAAAKKSGLSRKQLARIWKEKEKWTPAEQVSKK